jgi:PKD repeat protein
VRQLERRRVLDGAATSVVVSAVASPVAPTVASPAASTTPTTNTTTADAISKAPVLISVTPASGASSQPASNADLAQGSALNTAPVLVVPLNQNLNEGLQLNLSGTGGAPPLGLFVDSDLADTHTATVNWGDGGATENATVNEVPGVGTLGGTHVYADDGAYTVTVTVMDNNGDSASHSFQTIVAPVNPTATLSNSGPVVEGAPGATVTFSNQFDFSSADMAAGFHYAYDVNNDGTFDVGDGTYGGSVTSASQNVPANLLTEGPSDHTVTARIIDKNGQFTDYTTTVHVQNAAPTLTNITGDTINENSVATIKATIVDPSTTDTFEVHADWLDGSTATISGLGAADATGTVGTTSYQWTAASRSLQLSHQYLDDGFTTAASDTYNVSLTAKDDDGDMTGPYTAPVVVNDLPPVLVVPLSQNVFEGDTLNLSGSGGAPALGLVLDTGTLDTQTATVNWGDGTATQSATVIPVMGAAALGGTHVYGDDGTYTVTVTVTDKDGKSDTDSFSVNVANRNPVVTVPPGNQSVFEGTTLSFAELAKFTDAGFDNPANPNAAVLPNISDPKHESFTYDINWGDGIGAVNGASVADTNGGPGTPSSGTIAGSHTYADDGTYTVTVTVHDDNGGVGSASFQVVVANQDPIVSAPHGNQTVSEGDTVSFNDLAKFTDFGFDNPLNPNPASPPQISDPLHESFTYDINWGDGTGAVTGASVTDTNGGPGVPSSGTIAGSHTYADDGTYTVAVTVHDDNGGVGSTSFSVTVANKNPLVTAPPGNQFLLEGTTASFAELAKFTDAGFDNPANPNSAAPPNITDPLHESFTYDVDWGDGRNAISGMSIADVNGGPGVPSSGTIAGSHTYADDGTYTVTITVHDDNGGVGSASFQVVVANQNPIVSAPHGNQTVSEGGAVSFSDLATFTDFGFDNPLNPNPASPQISDPLHESFTYDINWGDGRDAITGASVSDTNGGPSIPSSGKVSGSHTYADDGDYTVTVTVHDDNGGSDSASFSVHVDNVNPTVTVPPGNQSVLEGTTLSFAELAKFTDAGFDNPANPNAAVLPNISDPKHESFTYDIDWGDGRDAITGMNVGDVNGSPNTPSSGTIAGSHTYADDGTYTVTVTVHDDNGGVGSASFKVFVANQNPIVSAPHGNQTVSEGDTVSFNDLAKFTDFGFDNSLNPNPASPPQISDPLHESFTYDINWGDGRDAITGASIADTDGGPGIPSSGTISGSHTYADDGDYTVQITVHDDNGGVGTTTFKVHVDNVEPTLTGTTGLNVDEGSAFTLNGLGVGVTDPGFDNPLNTQDPSNGGQVAETLFAMSINWGDGTATEPLSLAEFQAQPFMGPTTATFPGASHTYADDGTYTVSVTIKDDDMASFVTRTFTIHVNNVVPTLTTVSDQPGVNQILHESDNLVIVNLGSITDPGFNNPLNPLSPPNGSVETFRYFVDWGDGTPASTGDATIDQIGSVGTMTAASFDSSHVYADDGTYTVRVRVADDDMPAFTDGNAFLSNKIGVDYVEKMFTVTITNVNPSFIDTTHPFTGTDVNIKGDTIIQGSYQDPGFDNPNNQNQPLPGQTNITDIKHESFTRVIDWGDGTVDAIHDYATAHTGSDPIVVTVTGPGVNQTLNLTNFGADNTAVLRLVTHQDVTLPAGQLYTFKVDWGNGTIQEFELSLKNPTFPTTEAETLGHPVNPPNTPKLASTTIGGTTRVSGNALTDTTGSFNITHNYTGPPDPLHSSAPIPISVTIVDDNNGPVTASIEVKNPGIQSVNIRIDTTPQVPRLVFAPPQLPQVLLDQATNAAQNLETTTVPLPPSELMATSDRYLELVVISPEGKEMERYRLRDDAISDLRGLIATLPDNHYKIYLVRTDNNTRRLVIDVFVRRGRVIDPSDQSEGTRDRPPEGSQQNQTQPLENNPQLQQLPPGSSPSTMNEPAVPADQVQNAAAPAKMVEQSPPAAPEPPSSSRLRWALPLAGLGLLASRGSWAKELEAAFDGADDRSWQRLRRAGRRRLVK